MWVNVSLKAPDEGSWVAITRVDDDGDVTPLGYIEDTSFKAAIETMTQLNRSYMDGLNS